MEVKVTSKVGKSGCMASELYAFLSDFRNIGKMLPPEHQEKFTAQESSCEISVNSYAQLSLSIVEREQDKLIKIGTEEGGEQLYIWIQFIQPAAYDTRIRITIQSKANLVTKWMMKKQLQKFADNFVDGLCQIPPQALNYMSVN